MDTQYLLYQFEERSDSWESVSVRDRELSSKNKDVEFWNYDRETATF